MSTPTAPPPLAALNIIATFGGWKATASLTQAGKGGVEIEFLRQELLRLGRSRSTAPIPLVAVLKIRDFAGETAMASLLLGAKGTQELEAIRRDISETNKAAIEFEEIVFNEVEKYVNFEAEVAVMVYNWQNYPEDFWGTWQEHLEILASDVHDRMQERAQAYYRQPP